MNDMNSHSLQITLKLDDNMNFPQPLSFTHQLNLDQSVPKTHLYRMFLPQYIC